MTTMNFSAATEMWRRVEEAREHFRSWNWRHYSFFLGVPCVLAVYSTINNWELLRNVGFFATAAFYLGHSLIPFWVTCVITRLIMELMRSSKPGQLALLLSGGLISSVIILPYTNWVTNVFFTAWGLQSNYANFFSMELGNAIGGLVPYLARTLLIWVGVNYLFDRVLGLPRYRYVQSPTNAGGTRHPPAADSEEDDDTQASRSTCQFLKRLEHPVAPSEVQLISAEQHYVRIVTSDNDELILYRFGDAVAELGDRNGMQVHRSHWVNHDAITKLRVSSKKMLIVLDGGREVPVSGPYQQLVRQFADRRNLPVLPRTRG